MLKIKSKFIVLVLKKGNFMSKKLLKTLVIGWIFAAIVETINMGIGQGLWVGMILTVLLFYGFFILCGYWYSTKSEEQPLRHFIIFGFVGLMFEWFIFGMVPWGIGNPIVMVLIQTGMFSHWATVTFGPRFLLDEEHDVRGLKKSFIIFYIIGMSAVFILGFLSSEKARWTIMILGNVIVYTVLIIWYVKFIKAH